ncbi:MAG: hypothetical protein CVU02_03515, partial [Bacteroidetes bacterium HGW-Bacteroidetes-19]
MIRKFIQWFSLAILVGFLVFFSVKQHQITQKDKAPTEITPTVQEPIDCSTQSCGSCPSKETCSSKGAESNATIPKGTGTDEFQEVSTDEFSEVTEPSTGSENSEFEDVSNNEFEEVSTDEFQETSTDSNLVSTSTEEIEKVTVSSINIERYYPTFIRFAILFIFLAIISIFYQTKWIHYFRYPILLASLIYFGFILGGCPCILVMFNDTLLLVSGNLSLLVYPVILLIIILLTILFGKIWCGWLCHLGALQEFLFRNPRMQLLRSKKAQKVLHITQRAIFLALGIWILIAQINIVCTYDPFIKIFTLSASGWLAYILVGVLILSSLLIYRPFCRAICPVGMLLNLTSKLPFANKIVLD